MQKVRWGILGAANIARRRAIPAIQASGNGIVTAIASRDRRKAFTLAQEAGIPTAYGDYQELLNDAQVDAVYIPLTNELHALWTLRAAQAQKHVLCEKPLALDAAEVRQIMAAAQQHGRLVMEGLTSNFHPVHQRVSELMQAGRIGCIGMVRFSLGWSLVQRQDDFRWQASKGGGGLLDLGGYCIATARLLLQSNPEAVSAQAHFQAGVDADMGILLRFPEERIALINCGILSAAGNQYEVVGTEGRIVVQGAFGNGDPSRQITIFDGYSKPIHEETVTIDQLLAQFTAFNQTVLANTQAPFSLQESLTNAQVMDACMASARQAGAMVVPIYV